MSASKDGGDRDRTFSEGSEAEHDPQFKPVVTLPEIDVPTNEEDEDVLVKLRAKLFRFDTKSDDTSEWKERGTGELKILKHRINKTARLVMRRDKTLKVCANHFLTPWMELKPSLGSDKAFVYKVLADFADEVAKPECLAVRFGSVEFAKLFKEKFEEAKEFVRTECSLYTDDPASDSDENEESTEQDKIEGDNKENDKNGVAEEVTKKLSELEVNGTQEDSKE